MVVGQSTVSDPGTAGGLPMRNAFAVLFFVAVGMLCFDYRPIRESPGAGCRSIAIILIIEPLAALGIVIIGGHSLKTALTVAGGLAQIGEFSLTLGDTAHSLGLIPGSGNSVFVAAAIVSISLNPVIFPSIYRTRTAACPASPFAKWLFGRREKLGARREIIAAERMQDPSAIVVGYGPVGQTVTRLLAEFEMEPGASSRPMST